MEKISWHFYTRRMKVNPAALIKREGCKSYEDLVKVLNERGVAPPPKDKVSSFFTVPEPPKTQNKPAVKAKETAKPPPKTRKKVSRRPRSTKQKLGVAAKNNAGSKDAPKSDS